jgi:hypothetical protein
MEAYVFDAHKHGRRYSSEPCSYTSNAMRDRLIQRQRIPMDGWTGYSIPGGRIVHPCASVTSPYRMASAAWSDVATSLCHNDVVNTMLSHPNQNGGGRTSAYFLDHMADGEPDSVDVNARFASIRC